MSQKASIIILNWNGLDDTIECIDSLRRITYPDYEVVVVDNASSGNDVGVLRGRYVNSITLIANDKNYGFSGGNNIGMKYAMDTGAEYIVLLNNDTVVDPEFLSELVKCAQGIPQAGILAGKIYYYDSPNRLQSVGGGVNWLLGRINHYGEKEDVGQFDKVADRDFIYANGMLIRRQVVETISYLDATFFFGIEEYDYCMRAIRAGFQVVYVPTAKIWHKSGASRKKLSQYPETEKIIIAETGGANLYKHFYRLFKKHNPPVIFLFSFASYMITRQASRFGGGVIYSLVHRDLSLVRRYLRARFKRKTDHRPVNRGGTHAKESKER